MSSDPEHLGWLIKRLQHRHHRALDAALAPLDVTLVQWNALREISRNAGASQHALAEKTFNSDQAFGTLLTRLEARGLVEREPGGGRANLPHLTARGERLHRQGQSVFSEVIAASFSALRKAEREELERLLNKVLDERVAGAPPRSPGR